MARPLLLAAPSKILFGPIAITNGHVGLRMTAGTGGLWYTSAKAMGAGAKPIWANGSGALDAVSACGVDIIGFALMTSGDS